MARLDINVFKIIAVIDVAGISQVISVIAEKFNFAVHAVRFQMQNCAVTLLRIKLMSCI